MLIRIEYYSFKSTQLNLPAKPVPERLIRHSEDLMTSQAETEQTDLLYKLGPQETGTFLISPGASVPNPGSPVFTQNW